MAAVSFGRNSSRVAQPLPRTARAVSSHLQARMPANNGRRGVTNSTPCLGLSVAYHLERSMARCKPWRNCASFPLHTYAPAVAVTCPLSPPSSELKLMISPLITWGGQVSLSKVKAGEKLATGFARHACTAVGLMNVDTHPRVLGAMLLAYSKNVASVQQIESPQSSPWGGIRRQSRKAYQGGKRRQKQFDRLHSNPPHFKLCSPVWKRAVVFNKQPGTGHLNGTTIREARRDWMALSTPFGTPGAVSFPA